MEIDILSALLVPLLTKLTKDTGVRGEKITPLWFSLKEKLQKALAQDPKVYEVLNQIEDSDLEDWPDNKIEIILDALQNKIERDTDFAKEIKNSQKTLEEELRQRNPEISQEYLSKVKQLNKRIENLQEDVENIKQNIRINVDRGDYLGKDPVILSGNDNAINIHGSWSTQRINHSNTTNYFFNSEAYIDQVLAQTEQIKGKITQFFTVKESMNELDKIRQPRAILTGYVEQELKVSLPVLFLGNLSLRTLLKNRNDNLTINDKSEQTVSAEEYFKKVKEIESKVGIDPNQEKELLKSLGSIADEINLNISRLNNSFILTLYPASSSKELVANMVSKIGYKELREEAEMHLSVISKLVDKLNNLIQKLDIDGLKEDRKVNKSSSKKQEDLALVKAIAERIKNRNSKDIKQALSLIQELITEPEIEIKDNDKTQLDKNIYVLSDEAQAAVGMMIDIEKRRDLVEKLVRSDRQQRNRTTQIVTIIMLLIICLMIAIGFVNGPSVTVGVKPLNELKLPLLNVPWPVVFWSFIGSFAAMIYRFNRQPIHEFGNVLKWTLTRLVQGVVLGSAFYLILVSGLSLLTGVTPATPSEPSAEKITSEVILILSFLVGFSDRFADSVFNTLIERYSKTWSDSESFDEMSKKD